MAFSHACGITLLLFGVQGCCDDVINKQRTLQEAVIETAVGPDTSCCLSCLCTYVILTAKGLSRSY